MTVTLDAATEELIRSEIDRGAFGNPSEAIACAVRLMAVSEQDDWLHSNREAVQNALRESLAAEEKGESYTPGEVQAMLMKSREVRHSDAA